MNKGINDGEMVTVISPIGTYYGEVVSNQMYPEGYMVRIVTGEMHTRVFAFPYEQISRYCDPRTEVEHLIEV